MLYHFFSRYTRVHGGTPSRCPSSPRARSFFFIGGRDRVCRQGVDSPTGHRRPAPSPLSSGLAHVSRACARLTSADSAPHTFLFAQQTNPAPPVPRVSAPPPAGYYPRRRRSLSGRRESAAAREREDGKGAARPPLPSPPAPSPPPLPASPARILFLGRGAGPCGLARARRHFTRVASYVSLAIMLRRRAAR